ncbi:MAPEG family protein [Leptospira sarikeiensis]|uniref:Microsomal glutathione S-transferase 1 n=1 Tax=Leptospira sarikeiensis TaxID=2484943 RepID=A0A4R9JZH0_9LEPT|nr:MAPEG family protein [Leptospira sarikeiensis]TGL57651.1 MAPEG family protein [Leptospira sarikeiensis]
MESSWQVFSIVSVLLFLKLLSTSIVQGLVRIKTKTFRWKEDAEFFTHSFPATDDHPIVATANGIFRNDLENIPIFLFLLIGYIQTYCWQEGTIIYSGIFIVSRVLHAIFYFLHKQPWRNISYNLGILAMLLLSGHILHSILLS